MRCIFCLAQDPQAGFTDEHIFPDAVGGTLVIRSVCKPCNDRLGRSVDVAVTDHTLVQMKRHALRIAGKSGTIPNPFERAVLADDPTQKLRLGLGHPKPGTPDIYVIPFVQRTQAKAGEGTLRVRVDASDAHRLGDIVNTALARAGAPPLSDDKIEELKKSVVTTEQPRANVQLSFDVSEYRRGLMKIAYELAWLWLGAAFLDDPRAVLMRRFILDDDLPFDPSTKYPIPGTMRMAPLQPLLPFWADERDHLLGCMVENGESLGVMVSVLGVLDALVSITDSAASYPARQQRFVCINPITGARRECSFEEEAARIEQSWTEAG